MERKDLCVICHSVVHRAVSASAGQQSDPHTNCYSASLKWTFLGSTCTSSTHCDPLKPPPHSPTHCLLALSRTKHLLSPLLSLSPNSHPPWVVKKSYKKSLFGLFLSLLTKKHQLCFSRGKVKSQRISTVLLMTMILAKSLNPFKYPLSSSINRLDNSNCFIGLWLGLNKIFMESTWQGVSAQ